MAKGRVGTVQFLQWSDLYNEEKPFQVFLGQDDGGEEQRDNNLAWATHEITLRDFRNDPEFLDIDEHGFTSRELKGFRSLNHRQMIEDEYLPRIEQLLKKEIKNASKILIFDWRIRDSDVNYPSGAVDFSDQHNSLLPSNFAHVDMAPMSVVNRIEKSFPQQAEAVFAQRVRAVNVWKPLDTCVEQWPLGLCDSDTISPNTLVETDSIRRDGTSTLHYATYDEGQKWYFLDQQTPDEVLIFKHFDSLANVKAPLTMHSSVRLRDSSADAPPRRSIEVRTLVLEQDI